MAVAQKSLGTSNKEFSIISVSDFVSSHSLHYLIIWVFSSFHKISLLIDTDGTLCSLTFLELCFHGYRPYQTSGLLSLFLNDSLLQLKSRMRSHHLEREREQTDHALMLRELQGLLSQERSKRDALETQVYTFFYYIPQAFLKNKEAIIISV